MLRTILLNGMQSIPQYVPIEDDGDNTHGFSMTIVPIILDGNASMDVDAPRRFIIAICVT